MVLTMSIPKTMIVSLLIAACLTVTAMPRTQLAMASGHEDVDVTTEAGTGADGGQGGGDGPDNGGICTNVLGAQVPCSNGQGGTWNGTCYESVWATKPEESDIAQFLNPDDGPGILNPRLVWDAYAQGRTGGVLVRCPDTGWIYWRESADPPPSIAELAAAVRLHVEGQITAPGIGIFPGGIDGTDPTISGLVGWPAWFWADNPGPGVDAPWTIEDTIRGYTLRAVARLDKIDYDTGDGNHITCGLGAEPAGPNRHYPATPPPKCSWTYEKRGHYTITATTHVTVDWSGAGRAGTIPITVDRSGRYEVAEVQVLIIP